MSGSGVQVAPGWGVNEGAGQGSGDVGDAAVCFDTLVAITVMAQEIARHVKSNGWNMERYMEETANMAADSGGVVGIMYEQEHLRYIAMIAVGGGAL